MCRANIPPSPELCLAVCGSRSRRSAFDLAFLWIAGLSLILAGSTAARAQLVVHNTPHFQTAVRGQPGDLLMVSGSGFQRGARAFYQYAPDPSMPPAPPAPLPANNDPWVGELDLPFNPFTLLDAYVNVPDSLTMRLPLEMENHWPYAIHVLNPDGEWSDPVFINDPRPLWLSPDFAYETAQVGSSPRKLRVVGRNLEPLHSDPMVVRLSGPEVYLLQATSAVVTGSLDHYLVEADLKPSMKPGLYRAEVMREGVWFPVVYGTLEVLPDPPLAQTFHVTSYGCQPNDNGPDAACLQAAIDDAASAPGGGTVFLAAGTWDLYDSAAAGQTPAKDIGILLRSNVDLQGASAATTELVRHPSWVGHTTITVEGNNRIRDLHFIEGSGPNGPPSASYLRLGRYYVPVPKEDRPGTVAENIVIHDCKLTGMYYGIGEGGFPLRRVHITDNEFHAYRNGLYLAGDPNLEEADFDIQDSVIERNLFLPGAFSLLDPALGTIASELGASNRLMFSNNVADGTFGDGWRAAFFWHQEGNQEMLLVSENLATCTGDQGHDGEAIAFDGSRNVTGFLGSEPVLTSSKNHVEVETVWGDSQPEAFVGFWAVVVKGPGLGQARRVKAYSQDRTPTIEVHPPWDVIPVPGDSEVLVTRSYWNAHVVDNDIDNRQSSGCQADNPKGQEGLIGNAGWTFDSAIEGNRQYESGGIHLSKRFARLLRPVGSVSMGIYASEIRDNLLDGEPQSAPDGKGEIEFWHSAIADEPSIVLSHNLAIAHNRIRAADGDNAAIGTKVSASVGTDPWNLSTIHIFRNQIEDTPVGITLSGNPAYPLTWRSVLSDNIFLNVGQTLDDNGQDTVLFP
ncbi:MAG: hypothetical protein AAGD06_31770 [Acidobacteriota bacterium]